MHTENIGYPMDKVGRARLPAFNISEAQLMHFEESHIPG
jgi:hypothetical protein